jgi:hypothetical protein
MKFSDFINEVKSRDWSDEGEIGKGIYSLESDFKYKGKYIALVYDNGTFTWNLILNTGELDKNSGDSFEAEFDLDFRGKDHKALEWIQKYGE